MNGHDAATPPPKGRLLAGVGAFALGWIVTLGTVWLGSLPASVTGMVLFAGPKLGVLAAIAIMGKPGFAYVKSMAFGYLKPPAEVSPARYRIGLVMFAAALLLSVLERYAVVLVPGPASSGLRFSLAVDLLLLTSILVLGGDFWDKIRALFIRDAKAQFPLRG